MTTTGIYKITNKINGKVYIGQSVQIERRFSEHLRAAQPDKYHSKNERDCNTPIHLAMRKYGISNFLFEIIEECNREELNGKERYWIQFFQSNNKEKGYNVTKGGQENFGLSGEHHSQAKLTQKDVNEIKRLLRETDMNLVEINELFPFVGKSTLSLINNGKTWAIPGEKYPIRVLSKGLKGGKNPRAKLNDDIVLDMRQMRSKGASFEEIYTKYRGLASQQSLESALLGATYKHLPIWDNTQKKWI